MLGACRAVMERIGILQRSLEVMPSISIGLTLPREAAEFQSWSMSAPGRKRTWPINRSIKSAARVLT